MNSFLTELLSDKKGGEVFKCFGFWHFLYMIVVAIIAVVAFLYIKNHKNKARKVANIFINLAFGMYIFDIFMSPLAYGEIDIEKLPFHICTAMCVMSFVSKYNTFLGRYKIQFAVLGFISNLVYLIYPAGVMWHQVHPLSYRVVDTLMFHGIMAIYGLIILIFGDYKVDFKRCYRDLTVIVGTTLWAILGNLVYNSDNRLYNWFFVVRDPFYVLPKEISPFIMPFLNIAIFFAVEMLVYSICALFKRRKATHGTVI